MSRQQSTAFHRRYTVAENMEEADCPTDSVVLQSWKKFGRKGRRGNAHRLVQELVRLPQSPKEGKWWDVHTTAVTGVKNSTTRAGDTQTAKAGAMNSSTGGSGATTGAGAAWTAEAGAVNSSTGADDARAARVGRNCGHKSCTPSSRTAHPLRTSTLYK